MKPSMKKYIVAAFVTASMSAVYAQSAVRDIVNIADAFTDASRERREQSVAPDHIKEVFALAKKSAEEDVNVNFCGFFTGMSRYDAQDLAAYYKLKDGEYSIKAAPGKAVSRLWFSLKGVRRITKGGNTLDELVQAVANRVGDMKHDWESGEYEHRTIDGVVVKMGRKGLSIQNDGVAAQAPLATTTAAQKDRADVVAAQQAAAEEAARRERAAAEEAARRERALKKTVSNIINNMVAIPGKNFKMGKYEVTQEQWEAVMGENPSEFKGSNNPVENVSWEDCKKFLEKLNSMPEVKKSGLTFRLPTEKEWEYACRAGSTGDYCKLADGTKITKSTLDEVAWYGDNSGNKTHPVGQKKPNAFGLYDMHGNVCEWCEDLYAAGGSNRVGRGGGWRDDSRYCTAGNRDYYYPVNRCEPLCIEALVGTLPARVSAMLHKQTKYSWLLVVFWF